MISTNAFEDTLWISEFSKVGISEFCKWGTLQTSFSATEIEPWSIRGGISLKNLKSEFWTKNSYSTLVRESSWTNLEGDRAI